ncbi:uncharacterized protein LOC135102892 isoform X2 [Scylla paramamosain]|uniref:uncharacterized protein LOC135102892 isoform X2 n=1 Tax=Scylla paramamosain TaxID=85552 RepID=UPI0030834580
MSQDVLSHRCHRIGLLSPDLPFFQRVLSSVLNGNGTWNQSNTEVHPICSTHFLRDGVQRTLICGQDGGPAGLLKKRRHGWTTQLMSSSRLQDRKMATLVIAVVDVMVKCMAAASVALNELGV